MEEVVVPLSLIALGAVFAAKDRRLLIDGWKSRAWPYTGGSVVDSEDTSFEIDGVSPYSSTRRVMYVRRDCYYVYEVDGRKYRSNRYSFGGNAGEADIHIGDRVRVYFDPENPMESVLKPGLTAGSLSGIIMCATGILVGIAFIARN